MRKHNKKCATKWSRWPGDRSNFPQSMAHSFVNDKRNQLFANWLIRHLVTRIVNPLEGYAYHEAR